MFRFSHSTFGLGFFLLLAGIFLGGCSEKPFLTQDASYVILSVSPSGMTQTEVVEMPWNANAGAMQKLLVECSFVMSDLRTAGTGDSSSNSPGQTTILQANYPEPKRMSFLIDQQTLTLDVQSIQIEVEGANVGQVTINHSLTVQGINNPNLQPAFETFRNMLKDKR